MKKIKKASALFRWQQRAKNPGPDDHCAKCGHRHHLSVDHIVPVSWIEQFIPLPDQNAAPWEPGNHPAHEWEENFELLCTYCNRMKGNSIDPRNPKVYEILERLIARGRKDHLPVEKSFDTETAES